MTNNKAPKPGIFSSDRNKVIAVVAGTTALIAASFGAQAVAESKTFQHAKLVITEGTPQNPFVMQSGWSDHKGWRKHRRGHKGFANLSDAEIEKRINRVVRHVSIEIDATKEQETKITTLLTAVAKDMRPLRKEFKQAGFAMRDILTAETIDRVKLEKLRAERFAEADRISKELTTAAADVAEVLTAEQRKTINERIEQFRSMRRGWHRG